MQLSISDLQDIAQFSTLSTLSWQLLEL